MAENILNILFNKCSIMFRSTLTHRRVALEVEVASTLYQQSCIMFGIRTYGNMKRLSVGSATQWDAFGKF